VFNKVIEVYRPEVIVSQCGADSLYGDPIEPCGPFNLTVQGYCECIKEILKTRIPTMFLGGGKA
jgi:histone deacetylase 1/2